LKKKILILLAVSALVSTRGNQGFGVNNTSNPRAMGMGGAFTALARGSDAPSWNPANLGLSGNPAFSLTLVDFGMGASVDGISTRTYNDIVGKHLTEQDKKDLLDGISDDGLGINLDMETKLLSLGLGPLALNVSAIGGGFVTLPKDLFDFLLNGNQLDKPTNIGSLDGEMTGILSVGLSGAYALDVEPFQEFAVGAGFKYYKGISTAKMEDSEGQVIVTLDKGLDGNGFISSRRSMGGSGMGIDLGVSGILENDWIVSLGVINLVGGTINWTTETEVDSAYFKFNQHYIDEIIDSDEDFVSFEDTTYATGSFTTTLPRVIHLGLAREWKLVTVAFDFEKASVKALGYSTSPRLSCGAELRLLPILPLRAGVSFGGAAVRAGSVGLGLHLPGLQWDLAVMNKGSILPSETNGFAFATGFRLVF